jgi:hypothetical protein
MNMKKQKRQHMMLAHNQRGAYSIVTAMGIFLLVSLAVVSRLHSKIMGSSVSKSCSNPSTSFLPSHKASVGTAGRAGLDCARGELVEPFKQ